MRRDSSNGDSDDSNDGGSTVDGKGTGNNLERERDKLSQEEGKRLGHTATIYMVGVCDAHTRDCPPGLSPPTPTRTARPDSVASVPAASDPR